jgi:glycosyltransferase involved in cell wall biosynthesis
MKYTFAVTAYQETSARRAHGQLIRRCLSAAQEHPRIAEIVVVDDCSDDTPQLEAILAEFSKVKLFRNPRRRRVFGNKLEAVFRSRGEWVINCDSDNYMDAAYIDLAIERAKCPGNWYCPTFARPHFDYRDLVGTYDICDIKEIAEHRAFSCFINTGNNIVNRKEFRYYFESYRGRALKDFMPDFLGIDGTGLTDACWDGNDSRILNLIWLRRASGLLTAVRGLEYEHTVSDQPGNYVECAGDPRCGQIGELIDKRFTWGY